MVFPDNVFSFILIRVHPVMPNTLSGKTNYGYCSSISLSGKQNGEKKRNHSIVIPNKIKELKVKILNDYLIPLYSKQWTILKENMFFIFDIQRRIAEFVQLYKSDEFAVYIDLLKVLSMFMDNYNLLQFQEENIHGIKNGEKSMTKSNETMRMIFQTAMIKLLPEYEIYNSILGKPKRELNQIYDGNKVEIIKKLLTHKDVTYCKIKEYITQQDELFTKLKDKILNDYLIPLYSKQWTVLKENMFFISEIQKKIIEFNELYELDEARLYIDLLKVLTMFMDNYKLMKFQEEKAHGSKDPNEVMSMIFQTAMIKLLPEYEIYNSILGKPNRESKQVYDQCIIEDIKDMLVQENITFYKIKECILHKVNRFSAE